MISSERWRRIEAIYHAAQSRPFRERSAYLAAACAGDDDLRREVESLLAQTSALSDDFLAEPTAAVGAGSVTATGDTSASLIGARHGHFHIVERLGAGGMGEVYRARDTKLGRDVAIKILPHAFTSDPERLARFEREARVLASLNHPHIGAIYGLEDAGGLRALVLELIDGQTLADRIRQGPLPLNETLSVAAQLAAALDAAHERGIVHRDFKPANIKITPEGVVKVLDFGIAKASSNAASSEASRAPTVTVGRTHEGLIIGTAAYMSPEQARGQSVDKRTDIWAFGCVLYEMLTGQSAFAGETVSDIIAAVLGGTADWNKLPAATPRHIRELLARCLQVDPRRRLRDIGDARLDLDVDRDWSEGSDTIVLRKLHSVAWIIATMGLAVALGWWTAVTRQRGDSQTSSHTLSRITWDGELASEPTLSPDGTLIVYASNAGGQANLDLWLQRVAGGPPVRLTQDVSDDYAPHFSPDGTVIAFRSERADGGVYAMPSLGGDARLIAPGGRDPQFSPDGTHIAYWTGGILGGTRVTGRAVFVSPANGGTPRPLSSNFATARRPVWSPDGKGLVFFGRRAESATTGLRPVNSEISTLRDDDFDWWWVPADGGESVATGVYPALLASGISFMPATDADSLPDSWGEEGILFSATTGQATNLWRIKVSAATGKVDGVPVQLTNGAGADRRASADRSGNIVFEVSRSNEAVFALAVEAQTGKSLGTIERLATGWELGVHRGSVSQDGRVLAYPRHRPNISELWVKHLTGGGAHHLVTTPSTQLNPITSADGSQVAYAVIENDRSSAYVVATSGGSVRKVCDDCIPHTWVSDTSRLVVELPNSHPTLRVLDVRSLTTLPLFDTDKPLQRVFMTEDDRWIAIGAANVAWIVRFGPGHAATPDIAFRTVTLPVSDVTTSRIAGWSPDGRLLYSLLGIDGFRCLYAQRIDLTGATVAGEPFVVRHFHDPEREWGSTPMGNAITQRGFIFDQVEKSAGIWLLNRVR